MITSRLIPLSAAIALVFALPAQAQSLLELYQAAQAFDAGYQSAKKQFDANLAKAEQARAGTLPSAGLAMSANMVNINNTVISDRHYNNAGATLSASQPLYRPANQATAEQGKRQIELATVQLRSAEQDLIVRVSQAYFDVLAASDTLTLVKAQQEAVGQQLASAKRNFEVGTATITDTREAQARFDLTQAQQLAASNDFAVKSLALAQLTGKASAKPNPLLTPVVMPALNPGNMQAWVSQAEDQHPAVQQATLSLEVAKLETQKALAGKKPTVDLVGNVGMSQNNGNSGTDTHFRSQVASVGVAFNLPLFTGYAVQNRIKETVALEDKARTDLEGARRTVAQATRSAYLGVQSGLSQVKALQAAEASSQSALEATKLGYQVGVRINIDVLNAQSAVYDTKTKLAKARYDVLLGGLKLRQASGALKADDLGAVNAMLAK
jgi:outer membrane protein